MAPLVLIVDDDSLLCSMLQIALKRNGYESHVALSGKEALEYLENNRVSLLLLDVMMADMDGFGVMQRVREHPVYHDLPIIMLTAHADPVTRQRGLAFGANDYLVKPVTPDKIVESIHAVMRTPDSDPL